jgi:hypothetical protein
MRMGIEQTLELWLFFAAREVRFGTDCVRYTSETVIGGLGVETMNPLLCEL